MKRIKEELYKQCMHYAEDCIQASRQAINDAIESANDDTKSSAGDKYETGREMMQQEIDRNRKQLDEAVKMKNLLLSIDQNQVSDTVQNGSLVITNLGKFYISISRGQLVADGNNYFAVSAVSPIGAKLIRQKKGYEFNFNGKIFKIEDVL
ncbi:3-oxoacyl-ACP synthase [Daejeonella sp. H1SJ63]|jgi:transcription elongation GreA/GreB family factor|uniref:3-oxoacyl-ACP synthase n=1 Tax=Daejeonella sp. H1SJ63 TaxID=3034145 RepID=UPI0023EAF030|nr:3-oxoacyl-ACP synthase [Daejeonella sp. H1SJ63]